MALKRLPGALALGLLASLAAHSALFGGDHAMGGAYHGALIEGAAVACTALLGFIVALAWLGARTAADGSVLARRMGDALPTLPAILLSAGAWFAIGERIEPSHGAAPLLVTIVLLVLAAWLSRRLAIAALGLLARAILAGFTSPFALREPMWSLNPAPAPLVRRSPHLRRRLARPPPIVVASPRA
ncbi:MAG: hypothetical protein JO199_05275 [Candidatus Eremiobacteraeota bacterium]|nr:hypothetical protein [Candidatus Eremiobacteraeota bacterium]